MDQIGRYRIIGELGRGAMGVVYHATDPSIGRSVAIKTIRIHDINDTRHREKLRERLFREARSAGVLSHPNIVTIYDMDEVDGLAYIAMAYVNGPTLEKILASEQPLSGTKMLRILRQSAAALDYAHARGIIHRDVKPANIMTDEDGSVKITDFGIAKITEGAHSTETRTVAGTPNYMSPEQVQGLAVDGRSDQFSLAVIAYEILTGERPFLGEHLSTIIFKIVAEDPPSAYRVNTTLTQQIDEVLRKGLSKKPEDRFPNCASFVGALELACAESRGWKTLPAGAAASMPTMAVERPADLSYEKSVSPPPAEGLKEPRSRSRMIPALLSLVLVTGLAALFLYQSGLMGNSSKASVQESAKPETPKTDPEKTDPEKPDVPPITAADEPPRQEASKQDAAPDEPAKPVAALPKEPGEDAPPARTEPAAKQPSEPRATSAGFSAGLQDIWIMSNPPNAKAVIDGNLGQACNTPCTLRGLPGRHNISISQAGYISVFKEVNVGNKAMDVPLVTLEKPMGTLYLTTVPTGASIRVNGQMIPQTTPWPLKLTPGKYSVTVEKNGISKTEEVDIGDSMTVRKIPLQP